MGESQTDVSILLVGNWDGIHGNRARSNLDCDQSEFNCRGYRLSGLRLKHKSACHQVFRDTEDLSYFFFVSQK